MSDASTTSSSGAARAAVLGVVLFLVSCLAPGIGLYTSDAPADVELFRSFGERILAGEIPYRDFFVEYPPGALPAFVLPALGAGDDYVLLFKSLQIAFGAAAIAFLALTLARLDVSPPRLFLATAFAGLAPLALGPTVLNRYDLWPAALLAAALLAVVAGRSSTGLALLAAAVLAKGYALVVAPPVLLYVWRRGGRVELKRALIAFTVAGLVLVLPFAVTGPGGLRHSVSVQTGRGLHLESLGGSLVAALDRVGAYDATVVPGFAFELAGDLPDLVAVAATLLQLAAIASIWLLYLRGPPTGRRLVLAAAASVAAFAAFGKVLSPQFLIWLLPLVPLAAGVVAPALLLAGLALTRWFFPGRYGDVVALGGSTWIVLARNLVLVALFAVLAAQLRAQRE